MACLHAQHSDIAKERQSDVLPLQVPLFAKIVKAWQATASRRKGLFNRSFDAELFRNSTDSEYNFGPLAETVAAHHLWLKYLDESWKVALVLCDPRAALTGSNKHSAA